MKKACSSRTCVNIVKVCKISIAAKRSRIYLLCCLCLDLLLLNAELEIIK